MSSPFESPAIRYGIGFANAAILVFLAFFMLDEMMRWIVLGIAVIEILVVPQVLKQAT
ncbi:hypothetical protein GL213_03055 [Halogeometricum borinquense]|uniref:Uncharacterized protein n=1 Tax=Halogeometricum borinquense (strain ATCC 700274 / DSM 11551 / JCM 10706 / KCTC 4070 / PR3) TaxID=469382 RepID=E4NMQ9_HALBP|nr:hypothetical protein [Halogeometricum borinquense]ADQ66214.1 hypothetical protein Hbor_06140 [Halogeometricum borinquense DSM 11551]ELY27291.1 hypothetical protein C499_09519 [Halogeometricum borinquense DSM 11551]QIQ75600.1 hypothetical protein GL213_03055 [Halogeometricum borinquense]